ncbi:MAG TPA: glycosyltransferase family 9 protein [Nitrospiraceae bacterium]|nr:glycosyltransferase family 9 protein [Nitrospiraceae bacterium]
MADDVTRRGLVIQLARLGDLVQSLPAIAALKAEAAVAALDLLCPVPFTSIGSCVPGIERVLAWEVERWRMWADRWPSAREETLTEIEAYLTMVIPKPYAAAFNLNQHSRSMLAATLLSRHVMGPGERGPLTQDLPPWAEYLRGVARHRDRNRVHLADVFCGLCGVMPPGTAPGLRIPPTSLPDDLSSIGTTEGLWIAVIVGAGDAARCVPPMIWREWIRVLLGASRDGRVVLIGSEDDCERGRTIQDGLSSLCLGRVWDATGRTTLIQTAALLSRCQWVVGSDTGPLHLGTAVGARAIGFYFARARVHETGPYGRGHWTWQAKPVSEREARDEGLEGVGVDQIIRWPIVQSVGLIMDEQPSECTGWTLWQSHLDRWGVYHVAEGALPDSGERREDVWHRLHRPMSLKPLSHEYV